jgi:hypothetical protein
LATFNPQQNKRKYMAGIRESMAQETYEYQTEPAIVAQVCQDVLSNIGKVKDVSRESGTISGRIGPFINPIRILLRISRKGDITELSVQTNRGEGLLTGNGAQKGLAEFMQAMGQDKRLQGKSTGGW